MPGPVPAAENELVVSREFDAPRELVYAVWTDPDHLTHFWGPDGFRTTTTEMNLRPGGHWRLVMHGPDGRDYRNHIVFDEVTPPERIVYRHVPESGTEPVSFTTTVTFLERGGETEVTVRQVFASAELCRRIVVDYGADRGGREMLGRLEVHLKRQLSLERRLPIPPARLFPLWTSPDALSRWFGPHGCTLPACVVELHPGGRFHFVIRDPNGVEYPFEGTFDEIAPPRRLAFSGSIDGIAGHAIHTLVTFTADGGGGTLLRVMQWFNFADEHTRGAGEGWSQTLDRLAESTAA